MLREVQVKDSVQTLFLCKHMVHPGHTEANHLLMCWVLCLLLENQRGSNSPASGAHSLVGEMGREVILT